MKSCCVVVIGHVDHGKTALVHALTGTQTDRLPEEKARGLSITNGFAHRTYPEGTIDLIDAPGHEDFIKAMVAGTTGAQAALIVVSATDGMQAQTFEHLAIAGLLGITQSVIAITKADLVSDADAQAATATLKAALAHGPFSDAPIILCSAHSGLGIGDLDKSLQNLLLASARPVEPLQPVLPIDRVFSVAGKGTIVTGTLLGDELAVGAEVTLQPVGRRLTIRGMQSRGEARSVVPAATRVAVNLRGIGVDEITRGDVLCATPTDAAGKCMDVHLTALPTGSKPLKHMEKLRVLIGISHEVATVHLFAGQQTGLAQLRFARAVFAYEGQRAILRRLSPAETIAGAEVLDAFATPTRAGDKLRQALLHAVQSRSPVEIAHSLCRRDAGVAALTDVARLSRQIVAVTSDRLKQQFGKIPPNFIAPKAGITAVKQQLMQALTTYHAAHPLHTRAPQAVTKLPHTSAALRAHVVEALQRDGQIQVHPAGLSLSGHDPLALLTPQQQQQMEEIEARVAEHCLTAPPQMDAFAETDLVTLLMESERIIALQNIALKQALLFHRDNLIGAASLLRTAFPQPNSFTTSQARAALGTTRKVIVPMLEYFDKNGTTVRTGDTRQIKDAIPVPPSATS